MPKEKPWASSSLNPEAFLFVSPPNPKNNLRQRIQRVMQRCLLSSSTTSCAALRLHPVMPKLETVEIISLRPSHLKFKKLRPPSRLMPSYPKLGQHLNLFTTLHSTSTYALLPNHLTYALPRNRNIISTCASFNCIRSSSACVPLSIKFFSQFPRLATKNDSMGVRDGRSSGFSFRGFNRHWKKPKGVAALNGIKGAPFRSPTSTSLLSNCKLDSTSTSLLNNANPGSTSTSPLTNAKPESKVSLQKKKQSRSKKNKEPISTTVVSDEAPVVNGSKTASPVGISNNSKNGQHHTPASEGNSTGNLPTEAHDGSASTKLRSKKKSRSSSRKRQPMKAVNEAAQKQTPQHISQGQRPLKQLYPPTGKSVMVVESVTKAKVIQGYLGDTFEVLPSYGHVRDLAARSGSVRPDDDFSMVWEVPSAAWTHLKSIKVALSGAENLVLASDPDREGEAIAWHIFEMLQQQDALGEKLNVARVVFHEITEASIKSALQVPREIDVNLVHAYLARRALDYLIGFNISPLLWRKLPGCQSAGRVQSAALSLICDREMEIDEFKPQEYWTIEVQLKIEESNVPVKDTSFPAHLTHYNSKKLGQFSISSDTGAKDIEQKINLENLRVISSKRNTMRRNPPTPYITSTLQQDAANKLNFPATYTMKLAQRLYEGIQLSDGKAAGLITYSRTDGLHISDDAVKDIRSLVMERHGTSFTPESARKYFKKVKNAQEAHEAIRPTNIRRLPSMLAGVLDEDSLKLYTLIWSRTMACQMEPATIEQIQLEIGNSDESIIFRSACSRVEFLGYQSAYQDVEAETIKFKNNEANEHAEAFGILSSLKKGDQLYLGEVELKQHHTQPPARYSEGSLVKKLEELGIGRPSTYASTLKVLQDRNYVTVKNRVLYPEFRGRMVSAFLSHHFSEVTDYSFTADMETELDNVSAGLTEWKGLLRDYWTRFSSYCSHVENVHIHQVEKMLEKTFGDFLFASLPNKNRMCPSCMDGTLIFKVSRFGAGYFIGCNQHPKCKYIAKTLYGDEEEEESPQKGNSVEEPKLLGLNPGSNEKVFLKNGPYGYYVQLGEDRMGYLPKRSSVSHIKNVDSITLEDALELLRYPVTLGKHPKDGHPVILKLAKVGFSVRHRRTIASVPKSMKPKDVTLEKALELLSSKDVRRSGRPKNKPKVEEAIESW
ncbi:PREDICTED: DNA topoisomerase 1 isoform X1 [Theobroma cacao]|uniref:DNA topoisomerase n=3 Tax=Theobroma cacao TaxID=3641 RepID=A0AB32UN75_THECC|nr:PREDICTED: DNA topoisomerase 1 isoform X1 [Theobroma cacao]